MNFPAGRDSICELQASMLQYEQQEIPIFNHFAHKTYAREMYLPAGCALVGKLHRYSCVNIIAEGTVRVADGNGVMEYTAPYVFVSPAGTKRAMYAITDVTWITCHPAETEDLDQIEQDLIIPESENILEDL